VTTTRERYIRQREFGYSPARIRMIAVGREDHDMLRFLEDPEMCRDAERDVVDPFS